MPAPIVFFDLAGPDAGALRDFYARVFGWPCGGPGEFRPGNAPDLPGAIRQDPAEMVLCLGVPDVSEVLQRVEAAGGRIDVERFEVPGVAVLGLFRDPAGNRMGLVELQGDRPKVP